MPLSHEIIYRIFVNQNIHKFFMRPFIQRNVSTCAYFKLKRDNFVSSHLKTMKKMLIIQIK